MHIEGKYLLVSYRDIPDTHFICENGGNLRIKVSKISKSDIAPLPEGFLFGIIDKWILVFENISTLIVSEQDEVSRAVHWYKCKLGLSQMNLMYL